VRERGDHVDERAERNWRPFATDYLNGYFNSKEQFSKTKGSPLWTALKSLLSENR
jgi:hypothetical protein